MNFQHLRFAIAVADTASFTRAADLCCVTQPALSNAVGQLEDELGARLFDRTTRSVTTTEFGALMIDKMRGILEARLGLLTSAAEYLARDDQTVRLGLSPLVAVEFSRAVMAKAEQVGLRIILTEMNKADIAPALQARIIDFGLCPAPVTDPSLRSVTVYREPLLMVSDQDQPSRSTPLALSDCADRKVLLVPDDCGLSDTVRTLFREAQVPLAEYEGRALGYPILEKWARMGLGITLLPASQITDTSFARPIRAPDGTFSMIDFEAHWTPGQETRRSFAAMLKCLGAETTTKTAQAAPR